MTKKIITYLDGSFRDQYGGWGSRSYYNYDNAVSYTCYGKTDAKDSGHIELIACVKTLAGLPDAIKELGLMVDIVEIRSDYKMLVNLIDNYNRVVYGEGLNKKYENELLEILRMIKELPFQIKAKKVSNKDKHMLGVHKIAKGALISQSGLCYRSLNTKTETVFDETEFNLKNKLKHNGTKPSIKWYEQISPIIKIKTNNVILTEDVHLYANNINFCGNLKYYQSKGKIDEPIVVRVMNELEGTYTLVSGFRRLNIAKLLNFEMIPAVVRVNSSQDI